MIPGSANPLLLKSAAAAGGYQIERSLRFNSSDSAYLSRTPAVAGNRRTWTWAGWVKRSALSAYQRIFSNANSGNSQGFYFDIMPSDTFDIYDFSSNYVWEITTSQVFRDTSAWYHILLAFDTTQATAANRVKLYINGAQVTTFSTATYPSPNYEGYWNSLVSSNELHAIGRAGSTGSSYFNGYLADIHFIDGQALTPAAFTEVSATTGQLIPKAYTGTFGTNGFWLKFSDNSAATAATLGNDYSGNNNDWTPNNLSVTAGNIYPLSLSASASITDRALAFDGNIYTFAATTANTLTFTPQTPITFSSKLEFWTTSGNGPGYFDQTFSYNGASGVSCSGSEWTTVVNGSGTLTSLAVTNTFGTNARISAIRVDNSILIYNSGAGNDSLVDTPTSFGTDTGVGGEVRGNYATLNPLDSKLNDNGTISNGNLQYAQSSTGARTGRASIGVLSGKWYWELTADNSGNSNVGVTNSLSNLGTYVGADANGWGYVASGSKSNNGETAYGSSWTSGDIIGVALNMDAGTITFYKNNVSQGTAFSGLSGTLFPSVGTSNVSTCSFTINFGQRAFAYTAPSGFKALCDTNLPSPVVAKPSTVFNVALDTGANILSAAQGLLTTGTDWIWIKDRANSNNHQLIDTVRGGTLTLQSNTTAAETTYTAPAGSSVAWCWDAGSSTVSNTQGSITSQVRANVSAGFSIVGYNSGSAGNYTVGHGLGVKPQFIITKARNGSSFNWSINHVSIATTVNKYLTFTTSATSDNGSAAWGASLADTNSTTFGISSANAVEASKDCIAYCFAPVVGYSNGFSYTGNGAADGSFVYLGFRPRLIMLKRSDSTSNWTLLDTSREGYNVDNDPLYPNLSDAEGTTDLLDITSNGFKLRSTDASVNASAGTYIGFAWAENPFQYARAR